jgi:hypothetical protein
MSACPVDIASVLWSPATAARDGSLLGTPPQAGGSALDKSVNFPQNS